MKSILVTGATGFVGSHIVESLMKQSGLSIVAACRNPQNLPKSFKGEVRVGDLLDKSYQESVLKGIDVVCHAAAWTSAWNHERMSDELFLAPSLALIDQEKRNGVKRFIFLSSTSVVAPCTSHNENISSNERNLILWPHMRNVARIENAMNNAASTDCEMTSLRVGLFVGKRYGIGMLSLLVPRLKTHLVPWVSGGKTHLPLICGEDIGDAFALAAMAKKLPGYTNIPVVGPTSPTVREVIGYLSKKFRLPKPHFSVPFPLAYMFARSMEVLDPLVPWEPLVTRSIVHLLEETGGNNNQAKKLLGFHPKIAWQDAIDMQMAEMKIRQTRPMRMAKPVPEK